MGKIAKGDCTEKAMGARRLSAVLLVCVALAPATHAVAMLDEGVVNIDNTGENVVQQLDALFSHHTEERPDLGESEDVAAPQDTRKHVTYRFKSSSQKSTNLGESRHVQEKSDRAQKMIQFGDLLGVLQRQRPSDRGNTVSSLNQALKAKMLMEELHPAAGSLASTKPQSDLGEGHSAKSGQSFDKLMHSKKKNMEQITKYLLERKKEGNPLTTKEDSQLQKFYYNRASTILKRIVFLKKGESPPRQSSHERMNEETTDEVTVAREHADAVIDRLRFDAKVANANAAYNKKMLNAQHHRQEAAALRHKEALKESLQAAQEKLVYDKKVADAETKYNKALSAELMLKKNKADDKVKEAEKEKLDADKASDKATTEAKEADKEAADAEKQAEEATKKAQELELDGSEKKHRVRGHTSHTSHTAHTAHIPVTKTSHVHLKSMLRYLQSAITKHTKITPQEQQLMQSFFIKRGSALLSQLAQVDPDATWHSKGVVRQEQYEMDSQRPDRLSEEWGSKNLKSSTVVQDFVHDMLSPHSSKTQLRRPGPEQAVGLFGSMHKLPLRFAPDASKPVHNEPSMDLGESNNEQDEQRTQGNAYGALMGFDETQ